MPQTIFIDMNCVYASQCLFDAVRALMTPGDRSLSEPTTCIQLNWQTADGTHKRFTAHMPALPALHGAASDDTLFVFDRESVQFPPVVASLAPRPASTAFTVSEMAAFALSTTTPGPQQLFESECDAIRVPLQVLDDLYASFNCGADDDVMLEDSGSHLQSLPAASRTATPAEAVQENALGTSTDALINHAEATMVERAPLKTGRRWLPVMPRRVMNINTYVPSHSLGMAMKVPRNVAVSADSPPSSPASRASIEAASYIQNEVAVPKSGMKLFTNTIITNDIALHFDLP